MITSGFDYDVVMTRLTPRQMIGWMRYHHKKEKRDRAFAIEAAMLGARGDEKALKAKFRELEAE